jgi:hypothetical protein
MDNQFNTLGDSVRDKLYKSICNSVNAKSYNLVWKSIDHPVRLSVKISTYNPVTSSLRWDLV